MFIKVQVMLFHPQKSTSDDLDGFLPYLLILEFALDILDGVRGLYCQSDGPSSVKIFILLLSLISFMSSMASETSLLKVCRRSSIVQLTDLPRIR